MMAPLETLREVNENLRSALVRLRPERRHCAAIRPRDFSDLLSQLAQAAECLRTPPSYPDTSSTLDKEVVEYRSNLEKLKRFLPDLHVRLLAEKSRLEAARTQIAAAAEWARASKKTL
jgi:hypothetical protein